MLEKIKFSSRSWLAASLWLWVIAVALCGLNSFWSESETWAVNVARHLFQGDPSYFFGTKPLLDLLLWTADQCAALFDIHPMWVARGYMVFHFVLAVYLTQRLARSIWHKSSWAQLDLWLFGLFLSHSFVIKRYIQVRSDLLATSLLLLWVLLTQSQEERPSAIRRLLTFFGLAGAAALVTPKSVPLSFMTFFVFELVPQASRQVWLRGLRTWWGGVACLVSLLVLTWFSYFHRYDLLFLFESASEYDGGYLAIARWEHVIRALVQNPLFTVSGLLSFFVRPRTQGLAKSFGHWAIGSLLLLTFYPDRFPFFIASLVPIFLLGILGRDWPHLLEHLRSFGNSSYRLAIRSLQFGFVLISLGWCYYSVAAHSCQQQLQWSTWLEEQLHGLKDVTLFDPDGLVPLDQAWHWFIGPASASNQAVEARLIANPPDILLAVSRLRRLSQDFEIFVFENYWTDERGIFVHRWDIPATINASNNVRCRDILVGWRSLIAAGEWPATRASVLNEGEIAAYVEAILPDGGDVTLRSQSAESRDGMVTLNILQKCDELAAPPGTKSIALTPFHIHSPVAERLDNMFRFNSED